MVGHEWPWLSLASGPAPDPPFPGLSDFTRSHRPWLPLSVVTLVTAPPGTPPLHPCLCGPPGRNSPGPQQPRIVTGPQRCPQEQVRSSPGARWGPGLFCSPLCLRPRLCLQSPWSQPRAWDTRPALLAQEGTVLCAEGLGGMCSPAEGTSSGSQKQKSPAVVLPTEGRGAHAASGLGSAAHGLSSWQGKPPGNLPCCLG